MKNEKSKKIHSKSQMEHLKNAVYQTRAASPTDCTGITPIIPDSDYMAEAYEDLMDVPVTARHKEKNENGNYDLPDQ
ncbi:MAG: hypothetical protein IJ489_00645 [Clostridia bacterium]|nr:hypothetical protein [Clostridia bacterium]